MKKLLIFVTTSAILIGAGFVGWTYWQERENKNINSQSTNQTQNDPSENGKYLVIKEWGVRFEVPEEYRGDVYYSFSETSISLASKKYTSVNSQCAADQVGLGGAVRRNSKAKSLPGDENLPPLSTAVGDFNYHIIVGQAVCDRDHAKEITQEARSITQAMTSSLELIQ